MKGISFPISPSFVHNYTTAKSVKLKQAQKVCTENNIPFCVEEDKFYKLKQNSERFKSFERAVNSCYENKRPQIVDVGMSILEESELQPPLHQVSVQYDDTRQYMPDLALKGKFNAEFPKMAPPNLVKDSDGITEAFERLESKRIEVIA